MPAPAFSRLKVFRPSSITPFTVRLPAVTVTGMLAPKVTAPAPITRSLVPVKVKPVFQAWAPFPPSVRAPPEVLSRKPPLRVRVPLPRELA